MFLELLELLVYEAAIAAQRSYNVGPFVEWVWCNVENPYIPSYN